MPLQYCPRAICQQAIRIPLAQFLPKTLEPFHQIRCMIPVLLPLRVFHHLPVSVLLEPKDRQRAAVLTGLPPLGFASVRTLAGKPL